MLAAVMLAYEDPEQTSTQHRCYVAISHARSQLAAHRSGQLDQGFVYFVVYTLWDISQELSGCTWTPKVHIYVQVCACT